MFKSERVDGKLNSLLKIIVKSITEKPISSQNLLEICFWMCQSFFQDVSFSPFFLLSWILTFPCLWEISFSSQMTVEPSVGYWAQIRSSSHHFIISPCGMLEFRRVEYLELSVWTFLNSVQYIFLSPNKHNFFCRWNLNAGVISRGLL